MIKNMCTLFFLFLALSSRYLFCPPKPLKPTRFEALSIALKDRPPLSPPRKTASTGGSPTPQRSPQIQGAGSGSTFTPPTNRRTLLKIEVVPTEAEPTNEEINTLILYLRSKGESLLEVTRYPETLKSLKKMAVSFLCSRCGTIFEQHRHERFMKEGEKKTKNCGYYNAWALRQNISIIIPEHNFLGILPILTNLLNGVLDPLKSVNYKRMLMLQSMHRLSLHVQKILASSSKPSLQDFARSFGLAKDVMIRSHNVILREMLDAGLSIAEYDLLNGLELFYDLVASQTYQKPTPSIEKMDPFLNKTYDPSSQIAFKKRPD